MSRYTLTISEDIYRTVLDHLWKDENENAGYLFARLSRTDNETRFVVKEFKAVEDEHVLEADSKHLSIDSRSFVPAIGYADRTEQCFIFVHSHPDDYPDFSAKDDIEEKELFSFAYNRIHHEGIHASLIFPKNVAPKGRVWLKGGGIISIERIRVIGHRFRFFDKDNALAAESHGCFDRQVRAFGKDIQKIIGNLHVAVVGTGGTGSAVSEQLIRLGVRKLSIYDGDTFDETNVNRVYGSFFADKGKKKTDIVLRSARNIGLETDVTTYGFIYEKEAAMSLRDADIIFGCTDDELGRSILNELAIRYYIPVIDMGVLIDSNQGVIESIEGRVTALIPGSACLLCREIITPKGIGDQVLRIFNPERAESLRKEGYAPELEDKAPAVIPFTSAIASMAITDLLQRLIGFMDQNRRSTEVIYKISLERIGKNSTAPRPHCKCSSRFQGIADTNDFLGMIWNSKN